MIRSVLMIMIATVSFIFTACADGRERPEVKADTKESPAKVEVKVQPFTGAVAKRALLDMDEQQIPPGVLVPPPTDEPIEVVSPDEISIGRYHCNLKAKTFRASAFYPNAGRHKFNHVSGVFERNTDGTWVAKITKGMSGH
jgi:hypothetical protein